MTRLWFSLDYYWPHIISIAKCILAGIVMCLIYASPYILRRIQFKYYDSHTIAQIISVKKLIGLNQTEVGGKVAVNAFDIRYRYQVEKEKIIHIETINIRTLGAIELRNLNRLRPGDCIPVRYQLRAPSKSMIVIADYKAER